MKKLIIGGLIAIAALFDTAGTAQAVPSLDPIGPEPNPGATPCVFIIPIATPGHWMCPEGSSAPEVTP